MERSEIIERRRALNIEGYKTIGDVGLDGDWVTPFQITSYSPIGPCLVAYHWFDAPSVAIHFNTLKRLGYLPGNPFNSVLDRALGLANLRRDEIYVTQAFHLLPATRSAKIPLWAVDCSFDAVTRHELEGRHVIALGNDAALACQRHGADAVRVCHPSSRQHGGYDNRARIIAAELTAWKQRR